MLPDITKLRCYKNFVPLRVVNIQKHNMPSNRYKIVQGKRRKIGSFIFSDSGHISSLEIKKKFRRKKISINALISLYKFVMQKAREKNIDCLHFIGLKSNPNKVIRLYSKVSYPFSESDMVTHLVPVNKKGEETVQRFFMPVEVPKYEIENIFSAIKDIDKTLKSIII